ncbi:MAG: hypothetical protein AB7O28_06275 [Vicinamibacterales bacterium]
MTRDLPAIARLPLVAALLLCGAPPSAGQTAPVPPPAAAPAAPQAPSAVAATATPDDSSDIDALRAEVWERLRQVPSPVAQAVRHDPSLLTNREYLAPYPALARLVERHPDLARNPGFFVGQPVPSERTAAQASVELFEGVLAGLAVLTGMGAILALIAWLVRALIDHRRWLRMANVQADVHTRLMDRLASNEDLLAYIQTPPGRRFLESAPIALDADARPASAPISRIVWSVQAGVVLTALGIGLYSAQTQVAEDVAAGVGVMGTIVLSLGIGFVLASIAAYAISARAGLVPGAVQAGHE